MKTATRGIVVQDFYSRTPREVRLLKQLYETSANDFYSRTPREVRPYKHQKNPIFLKKFLLTHPARGATVYAAFNKVFAGFLLTHPARGATGHNALDGFVIVISTHAPRERCDFGVSSSLTFCIISTHAPRERCDKSESSSSSAMPTFLLTHPARGATPLPHQNHRSPLDFYSRTPREVRLAVDTFRQVTLTNFYSRTPREVRQYMPQKSAIRLLFLLTHPARGATI